MGIVSFNEQASASVINAALEAISATGQNSLDTLFSFRTVNLFEYQNVQSYINSRRILSSRAPGLNTPLYISANDFACIDQGLTSGSIRSDSGVITTRENNVSFNQITKYKFSASVGDVNSLDSSGQLYSVISDSIPIGQFDVSLPSSLDCTVINIDSLTNPTGTTFSIYTSTDGLSYTNWADISQNGYRLTTFGNSTNTNYIRIVITPSAPDLLSGQTYSFGITDLVIRGSQFALRSEFNSRPMNMPCLSTQMYFGADAVAGLTYYISVSTDGTGIFAKTTANSIINLPGTSLNVNTVNVALTSGQNILGLTLPANYYPSTLKVQEVNSDTTLTSKVVIPGLISSDPNLTNITQDCIYVQGNNLVLLTPTAITGRNFKVSYVTGPPSLQIKVKAVLDTTSYGSTPMFKQVFFEAI